MSKATLKAVVAIETQDGRKIKFEKPVSVWQAMAQAAKQP